MPLYGHKKTSKSLFYWFSLIYVLKINFNTLFVGMTGFEPATPRPPGVCATGLRYIPFCHRNNNRGFVPVGSKNR